MSLRKTREKPTYPKLDLLLPVGAEIKAKLMEKEKDTCFGKHWDPVENDCAICADSELCCILKQEAVNASARGVEKKRGVEWLDKADFENLKDEDIIFMCDLNSGHLTTQELIKDVLRHAKSSDEVAATEWIKRFKTRHPEVSIKKGIVYYAGEAKK